VIINIRLLRKDSVKYFVFDLEVSFPYPQLSFEINEVKD
jgi:hypothetical protein